jgi:hypothetical protein
VVTPCLENSATVRKESNIRDVSTIEWDSSIPMTRKDSEDVDVSKPKVLIPLHSSQGLRCDLESLFQIISGVQSKCPQADITVSYSAKGSPWEVKRALSKYIKSNRNIKSVTAEIEGFGLVGIESIYMGTPVVAYDVPPMSNIITNGVNGMLVPCDAGGSKGGVMYAEPNPSEFISVAANAINDRLLALNKNTKVGRRSVRSMFYSQWKKLIEG